MIEYFDKQMSFVDISQLSPITPFPKTNQSKSKSPEPRDDIVQPSTNANVFDKNEVVFSCCQDYIEATDFANVSLRSNDFIYEATISQYEDRAKTLNNITFSKSINNYATIDRI